MRNLNEVEMNLISGGGDMGPDNMPPTQSQQGPTLQDLINGYNATHPSHPLPPA